MRTVRSVVRARRAFQMAGALGAVLLAVPGLVTVVPAAQAAAAAGQASIGVAITGMSPSYATSGSTVTVAGTLANHTGAPVTGITVQAQTSSDVFNTRSEMTSFSATGSYPYLLQPAGLSEVLGTIRSGQTVGWSVSFPADEFYTQFGVFPVQVAAATPDGAHTARAQTFLPYWPGGSTAAQPKKLQVTWVWPLVDTPQQGACNDTLATNELAGSVAGGGRLSALLAAGSSSYGQADEVTWDIDPALLSDVSVMTGQYYTVGNDVCSGRFQQQPSKAAASWLTQLRSATAGQPSFLTSYANVDVAALSHTGLEQNIRSAYQLGRSVAAQILPGTFGKDGTGTGDKAVLAAAWPADGQADAGVVTDLASDAGISTVVLASDQLQSDPSGYDNATAHTTTDIGTSMAVLLADSGITSLLGLASPRPTESGQFAITQDLLAETAMISSEAPNAARSVVIAPPTNWDPSAAEATALLRTTEQAPWLRPASMSELSAQAAKLPSRSLPSTRVSRDQLPDSYLDLLQQVNTSTSVFTNLLYQPSQQRVSSLQEAVAASASSAWRGPGLTGGWLAINKLYDYLYKSERKVTIIASKKILLAGNSGETPVSVKNGLGEPVQVHVTASAPTDSPVQVGPLAELLTVQAGKTNTVRMPVHAASIGTTTVQLQLVTQDGSPLTWTAQSLSVEVTRVGRFLLTVIGGALGILILTSIYRLRRKRLARARSEGSASDAGGAG
jgi:hypothetical protein